CARGRRPGLGRRRGCRCRGRRRWRLRSRLPVGGPEREGEQQCVHHEAFPAGGAAAVLAPRPADGAGLSSSTKVVATQVAMMVAFGSGLSFPFTSRPLMFTMRVNLPTRSKKIARL